jgi:imidazolonepropionase-like amidohydrolase
MIATLLACALAAGDSPSLAAQMSSPAFAERLKRESIVLQAAEVHAGDGAVFKPGVVILLDSKVVAVGPAPPLPAGSRVIDCGGGALTPGLVDAACQLGTFRRDGFAEQASEVIPHLDAADALDLHSKEFERLAREGVTTVFVTGEASSVVSCKGAAVKTAGPVAERRLPAKPCVKATIGPESSRRGGFNSPPSRFLTTSIYQRRPTTRMGSAWVFRRAFFDALAFRDGRPTGEDPAALRALLDVLTGSIELRMQARGAADLFGAARLCDEFGLKFSLEYASEVAGCLDFVAARRIPVVFGPLRAADSIWTRNEGVEPALEAPKRLAEKGVVFCISACDGIGEGGLARQAGLAVRHGLERGRALRAVTVDAAAMLGLEGRVGRLAEGLDADLVLWNGSPLDDSSRPVLVLVNGRPVFDPERRFAQENS